MREFVVTLLSGTRYTVRAERFRETGGFLAFVDDRAEVVGQPDPFAGVVALFDRRNVLAVVDRASLVAEEQREPVRPDHVADRYDNIPF